MSSVRDVCGRALCCLLIVLATLAAGPAEDKFAFYDLAVGTEQSPGDVLRSETFPGAPDGATAHRILYASTTPEGAPAVVSALVIVPASPSGSENRPILAWLHPMTGVARGCAPSLGPVPFAQIQGLGRFLAAGYVVVATDYPGLGTQGVHPFLVGESEARASLDAVRAVTRMPGAQAGNRFAVWGHSQGGHAALFTAQIAERYAPDLHLMAVAVAAPAIDLPTLIGLPGSDPLWPALLANTIWSWSHLFGIVTDTIVPAATSPTVASVATDCLETGAELKQLLADAAPLRDQPIGSSDRWRALLATNTPAAAVNVPVFLAQGEADTLIPPAATRGFARALCGRHVTVSYLSMPGTDHYSAAQRSAPEAAAWIADRFAGRPPPDDCQRITP